MYALFSKSLIIVFFSYPLIELVGLVMLIHSLATCNPRKGVPISPSWSKRIIIFLTVIVWPSVLFYGYVMLLLADMPRELYPHQIALCLWGITAFFVTCTLLNPRNGPRRMRWAYQSCFVLYAISVAYSVYVRFYESEFILIPLAAAVNQFLCFLYLRKIWKTYQPRKTKSGDDVTPLFDEKSASPDHVQDGKIHLPSARKERNMYASRVVWVGLILLAVSIGWMVLGRTISNRTEQLDESNSAEIVSQWGPKVLVQVGPYWKAGSAHNNSLERIMPRKSDIRANVDHTNRYKGLLWFSTFTVDFDATYILSPEQADGSRDGAFCFPLPRDARGYDRMVVDVDGVSMPISVEQIAAGVIQIPLRLDTESRIHVHYATGGQDVWLYSPAGEVRETTVESGVSMDAKEMNSRGTGQETIFAPAGPPILLPEFQLTLTTNFDEIDYPRGTASPSTPASQTDGGMSATWQYDSAVRSQAMGVTMPQRTNAGPIAARMSYYAPVSLVLFVAVLLTLVVRKGIILHPMHFAFIAAGFFAFQILLAYLADILNNIHLAFWISAVVSVALVVSYMRLVAGVRFAVLYAGGAQLVYLVGFSYAFFWVGRTGLTVTILSIVTLFIMMQATGRLDWQKIFSRSREMPPPIPDAQSRSTLTSE